MSKKTTAKRIPLDWKLVDVHQGTRVAELPNGDQATCTPGFVGVRLTIERLNEADEVTMVHEHYYDTMLLSQDAAEQMGGAA